MNTKTITREEFAALLGTEDLAGLEGEHFFPLAINGAWNKEQCEDFANMQLLQRLSHINHHLIGINAKTGKLMKAGAAVFKRHSQFILELIRVSNDPLRLRNAIANERLNLLRDRAYVAQEMEEPRKRLHELYQLAHTLPNAWGRDAYRETIGDIFNDLYKLRRRVFQLGRPVLFNNKLKAADERALAASCRCYLLTWLRLSREGKDQLIESNKTVSRETLKQAYKYTGLADEYTASLGDLQQINAELKARKREANIAYTKRIKRGDYQLLAHSLEDEDAQVISVQPADNGSYTLTIPPDLAEKLQLTAQTRLKLFKLGKSLLAKSLDQ